MQRWDEAMVQCHQRRWWCQYVDVAAIWPRCWRAPCVETERLHLPIGEEVGNAERTNDDGAAR